MKKLILNLIYVFFASSLIAQSPTKGLIAEYLFNGNTEDNSSNQNNGLEQGQCIYVQDRFGNECGAMEFNGIDAFVTVPHSNSLNSVINELTISLWFKTQQGQNNFKWITAICKGDSYNETYNSPQYRLQVTNTTISMNTAFTETHSFPFIDDHWYHYAMTYDGKEVKTYLDGKKIFEFPYVDEFYPSTSPLYIGRDIPGSDEFFKGSMDEIRIYNRALSKREIKKSFKNNSEKSSIKYCQDENHKKDNSDKKDKIINRDEEIDIKNQLPSVEISNPSKNPYKSKTSAVYIYADVKNVSSKKGISVTINNKPYKLFSFINNNEISLEPYLNKGFSTVKIKVTNKYGTDSDVLIVNYQEDIVSNPPIVSLIKPKEYLVNTDHENEAIIANITNISSEKNIEVKLNNQSINNFSFNKNSGELTFDVKLHQGFNIFSITATNKDGVNQKYGQIKYTPKIPLPSTDDTGKIEIIKEINLTSDSIEITCYDHNIIDGDIVTIYFNDQIIFDKIKLQHKSKKAAIKKLKLEKGHEYLIISKAWNEGTRATNTVAIEINDSKGFRKVYKLNSKKGQSEALKLIYN